MAPHIAAISDMLLPRGMYASFIALALRAAEALHPVEKGGILDVESRKNAGNERPRASPAQLLLAPNCANGAKIGEGEFRDGT